MSKKKNVLTPSRIKEREILEKIMFYCNHYEEWISTCDYKDEREYVRYDTLKKIFEILNENPTKFTYKELKK